MLFFLEWNKSFNHGLKIFLFAVYFVRPSLTGVVKYYWVKEVGGGQEENSNVI